MKPFPQPLRDLCHRQPCAARLMPEALTITNEDIKDTSDEWLTADSISGLKRRTDGGLELERGSLTSLMTDSGLDDGFITELDQRPPSVGTTFKVAKLVFANSVVFLERITANLHPKRTGAAQEVAKWACLPFQVVSGNLDPLTSGGSPLQLQPLVVKPVLVTESGSVQHDVTFDFQRMAVSASVEGDAGDTPVIYVFIWALKSDGSLAGNVGWATDSTQGGSRTVSSNVLSGVAIQHTSDGLGFTEVSGAPEVPRVALLSGSYSTATVTFSTNDIDLSAAPTNDVQVTADADDRFGTSVLFEIEDPGSPGWVTCVDGDLVGEDNTSTGGSDLSSMAKVQAYHMRAALTPNGGGDQTPIVRRMGLSDVQITDLSDVATVTQTNAYQTDPFKLNGHIGRIQVTGITDGIRDYNSRIEILTSENHIADISIRVFWGHPNLDRKYWLHYDTYLVTNILPGDAGHTIVADTVLREVRGVMPRGRDVAGNWERPTYIVAGDTLKTAMANLLVEADVLTRYRGQLSENTTNTASKSIQADDGSNMLSEFHALNRLAGTSATTRGGKIVAVDFFDDRPIFDVLRRDGTKIIRVDLGFDKRHTLFYVPYAWERASNRFTIERRSRNDAADANLGIDRYSPERLDPVAAKWIDTEALADLVADRVVNNLGTGVITIDIETDVPHPHLELGDALVQETDKIAVRDPLNNRVIRGNLFVIARIIAHEVGARKFSLWVQAFTDILSAQDDTAPTRTNGPDATAIILADVTQVFSWPLGTLQLEINAAGVGGIGAREVRLYMSGTMGFTPDTTNFTNLVAGPITLHATETRLLSGPITPGCDWDGTVYLQVDVRDLLTKDLAEDPSLSGEIALTGIRLPPPDVLGRSQCAIAIYPFAEGTGTTVRDISDNGNDITNSDTAAWTEHALGPVHEFNSTTQFRATDATAFDIGGSAAFTIDFVIALDGTLNNPANGMVVVHDKDYSLGFASDGQLDFRVRDHWVQNLFSVDVDHLWENIGTGTFGIYTKLEFFLITVTYSGSGLGTLYVNGFEVDTMTLTGAATTDTVSDNLDIGHNNNTDDLEGYLRYVRISNGIQLGFPLVTDVRGQPYGDRSASTFLSAGATFHPPAGRNLQVLPSINPLATSGSNVIVAMPPAELCKGLRYQVYRGNSSAQVPIDIKEHDGTTDPVQGAIQLVNLHDTWNGWCNGSNWYTIV